MKELRYSLLTFMLCLLIAIPITPMAALASTITSLTAVVAGTSQIYLDWNAFDSASSYTVTRSTTSGGPFSIIATTSSADYMDTGLSPGTTYYYRIEAIDTYGIRSYSSIVSAKTSSLSTPSNFTAEATGSNQIYLTWPSVSSASYYRISRSTSNSGIYSHLTMSNTNSYIDTNVLAGITYSYKLEAIDSSGVVLSQSIVSATPYASLIGLTAIATGPSQIFLSWDPFDSVSSYSIKRSTASDGTYSTITTTTSTNYTDTGLSAGTTYFYKIEGENIFGINVSSSIASAKTSFSSTPTEFTAEVAGPNTINLGWPSVNSASYYRISRSTSNSGTYSHLTMSNTNSYTDTNVVNGVTYYYKLEAITSAGTVIQTWISSTTPGSSGSQISSDRLAGANRYETSQAISKAGWNTSYYAVVVSGENYPDALCSAPLAYKYNAPILLTPKNSLDTQTKAELTRLNVKRVLLIGGVNVISTTTEQAIKNMGITVTRIAGSDRYDTSLKIAQAIGTTTQAVLTSGDNFPDVLSVAPIAAIKGMPVLLTPNNSISGSLKTHLQNSVQKTYVLGGSSVISDSVFNQLPSPERISGANRYDNNINIIKKFVDQLDLSTCYLATGESYPDALSGSALAALSKSPLILVTSALDSSTRTFIQERRSSIKKIKAFGGTSAIPDSVLMGL